MAPKRISEQRKNETKSPWLQLLDLEQQKAKPVQPANPEGHPRRRFPRDRKILLTMTDAESKALDSLVAILRQTFGKTIVRSDVVAFMSFRLIDEIKQLGQNEFALPDTIKSFTDLDAYLVAGEPKKITRKTIGETPAQKAEE